MLLDRGSRELSQSLTIVSYLLLDRGSRTGTRCEIATTLNIEVDNYKSSLTVRVNGLIKIVLAQINVRRRGPHAHIFSN